VNLASFAIAFASTLVGSAVVVPVLLALIRWFGFYTIVNEGSCKVYMLFGKVRAVITEPGLHFLPAKLGVPAFVVHMLGKCYELDMRLDQTYLRSQPVNSEEGAPMGIGIWYEMFISDPVAFLFKNADPRGSLSANVGNSTVRCLSNMKLADMLETRHAMSLTVRNEVSPQSHEWGYKLGSVYIRKVHFRDAQMIAQGHALIFAAKHALVLQKRNDGIDEILIPAGFSPVEWTTEPIDLGGSAEQVWSIVSATYNLMPLDPAVVKSLQDEFLAKAAGLADADGRVPCVMNVHQAVATRG